MARELSTIIACLRHPRRVIVGGAMVIRRLVSSNLARIYTRRRAGGAFKTPRRGAARIQALDLVFYYAVMEIDDVCAK